MITFKNIAGNKFLAVGTIQRKSALNGERSLTGVLYDGEDVLNKIDKGWSLEFDNEPYVVTYFERNDNDNSVSFDAIHKFIWDMNKSVLYSETSGSHTIKWYLDTLFADTGYSYALNFNPNAIQKENWGMKNKLSLFNDIISSIEGEFEINGTLISIFKNIGTDLSTIVRYGFNLSDMTLENDATSFVTYGEGFGEYADPENMTGDRLHVTYTSPLASIYGKLQAEPIDNRNYTISENLLAVVKKQVDDSFSVSVKLSLYDLSVAGYPYKMANVGDWLTAVDENLDFKQRIRIISIDDEFAADGTRISYTVTAGGVGVTKKYQDANASLVSKVEEAVVSSGQAITDANIALIAANGKNKSYYLNGVDDLPQTANEGDLAWVQSGDGRVLYIYTKKSDGSYYWEKRIDPEMGEQIVAGVNDAIAQAKENTDEAISENNTQINETINRVSKEQADLAIKDGDFNNKAQAMADKALADAKDNTSAVAQQTINTANTNIATAKADVVNSLNKEVSDRQSAVSALDSKAKEYADEAKKSASDGLVKEIGDRQSAITALDNKATSAINQAKSDVTDTINALSVGGRNYLTGTYIPNSTVGANANNQSKALYKITLDSLDSLYKEFKKTSDYFTLIFDWSYSGSNPSGQFVPQWNIAPWGIGGKYTVISSSSTSGTVTLIGTINSNWSGVTATPYMGIRFDNVPTTGTVTISNMRLMSGNLVYPWTKAPEDIVLDYTTKDNQIKATLTQYQQTNDGKVTKAQTDATTALGQVSTKVSQTDYNIKTGDLDTKYTNIKQTVDSQTTEITNIKKTNDSQDSKINTINSTVDGTVKSISDIKSDQTNQSKKINEISDTVDGTTQKITDIQTKDNNQDIRMGKIETTASGMSSDFSAYKKDADGRISSAQTTATTAVDGLKYKVSQADYDKKTGDLTTAINSTTSTANQSKQDIVAINQKNGQQDARMTSIESDANGVKTTVSNLQTAQGKQSGDISTLQQRADGFDATVTKVNNLSTGDRNYVLDTGNPKTQTSNGKDNQDFYNSALFYSPIKNWGIANGDYIISFDWTLTTALSSDMSASVFFNQSPWQPQIFTVKAGQITGHVDLKFKLAAGILTTANDVTSLTFRIMSQMASGNTITYSNLFMKSGTINTTWTPAPEDLSGATAKAQLTADKAQTTIDSYKTDADGRINKAQSDITQTAKDVTTKVSQTDYDKKTGDLSTSVSKAQQIADSATTTIGNYKTSNDNRVKAAETQIAQNTSDITLRATTADLNSAKSDYNAQIAQVKVDANAISQTISQVNVKVNNLYQNNLIINSDFKPDLSGWYISGTGTYTTGDYDYSGAVLVLNNTAGGIVNLYSTAVSLNSVQSVVLSWKLNYYIFNVGSGGSSYIYLQYLDSDKNPIPNIFIYARDVSANSGWNTFIVNNFALTNIPSNAKYIRLVVDARSQGTRIGINKPMLVKGTSAGDYVSGQYVNNDKIASQQITIDGISNTVSNQGNSINSLTSRVQTAEGNISTATNNISGLQTKITQTSNQISQEITDRANGDANTLQSSKDFTQSQITSAVSGVNSTITQTADSILAQVDTINMISNSEFDPTNVGWYTFSNSSGASLGAVWNAPSTSAFLDWPAAGGSKLISYNVSTWFSSEPKVASAGKSYSGSIVAGRTAAITATQALDLRIAFWDSSKKLISTASGGNIIDGSTYKGLTKYVAENKVAPSGTSFVSLVIAHSGAAPDVIGRPMLNIGSVASTYMPTTATTSSSTILSLFKDNWSIGIADNSKALASGIMGNPEAVYIVSTKIILNGDTTVAGTFTVGRANIADGAIGTAQIGDASITNAKVSNLDVNKLTGNITNFIQSNWNGVYGSTTITSSGMTIVSPGTVALFNVNGMTLDGAGGMTRVANGFTQIYSATHENIGMIGHQKDVDHDNVDYITFGLNGYRTTNEGDSHWVGGSDFYGGDGMGFGVSNKKGTYDLKLRWDSDLIAGYKGEIQGWHASDAFIFDDKTYHKGYADFSAGVTMSGAYSEGTRSLHTQGMSISTGAKWFGFMDGSNSTGFGTDQTHDVLFYVKGQVYSLYTMLGKLGMR